MVPGEVVGGMLWFLVLVLLLLLLVLRVLVIVSVSATGEMVVRRDIL